MHSKMAADYILVTANWFLGAMEMAILKLTGMKKCQWKASIS